jgi:anti-sigma factor RsiW
VQSCEDIADLLVDYADDELPEAESVAVAEHVGRCGRCRERLEALRRSLEVARVIWEDSAGAFVDETSQGGSGAEREHRVVRWWRLAPLAAAAALLIAVGMLQYPSREAVRPPAKDVAATTAADIEYEIARAAVASQLLTAADLLAEQPGGEEYA